MRLRSGREFGGGGGRGARGLHLDVRLGRAGGIGNRRSG